MSGMTGQASLTRTVELKGHVIDSLTLSKVIDRVQQLGGDYRLNDIRVGSLKKDVSAINLTLLASDQAVMAELLSAVAPYGAVTEQSPVDLLVCERDGILPLDAYEVKLPQQVRYQDQALSVKDGGAWTLVVRNGQAEMIPVDQLRQGDLLVRGTHGLDW